MPRESSVAKYSLHLTHDSGRTTSTNLESEAFTKRRTCLEANMKIFELAGAATLFLLLGNSVPGCTQEQEEHAKPQHQGEPQPATPQRPQEAKPAQREVPKPEPGREERAPQQEQKQEHEQAKHAQDEARKAQQRDSKAQEEQGRRAQGEQAKHGQRREEPGRASAAAGNRGARVPEDQFRAHFGRQHTFVVNRPVIIDNRPRFQYSGYWFEFVDVWPSDWAYTDECYIDYVDDGYYLFNPYHPGFRLAVVVVM